MPFRGFRESSKSLRDDGSNNPFWPWRRNPSYDNGGLDDMDSVGPGCFRIRSPDFSYRFRIREPRSSQASKENMSRRPTMTTRTSSRGLVGAWPGLLPRARNLGSRFSYEGKNELLDNDMRTHMQPSTGMPSRARSNAGYMQHINNTRARNGQQVIGKWDKFGHIPLELPQGGWYLPDHIRLPENGFDLSMMDERALESLCHTYNIPEQLGPRESRKAYLRFIGAYRLGSVWDDDGASFQDPHEAGGRVRYHGQNIGHGRY